MDRPLLMRQHQVLELMVWHQSQQAECVIEHTAKKTTNR